MAPKRKSATANESATVAGSTRVTRSSTRLATAAVSQAAPPKKKAKTAAKPEGKGKTPSSPAKKEAAAAVVGGGKTIVIEHCKQCNSFKTRAIQVKEGLEKGVAGVNVLVNPEKPRRGCFEIREEGGEVFVSLENLKRPFPPLKQLKMEELIAEIVEKIQ